MFFSVSAPLHATSLNVAQNGAPPLNTQGAVKEAKATEKAERKAARRKLRALEGSAAAASGDGDGAGNVGVRQEEGGDFFLV